MSPGFFSNFTAESISVLIWSYIFINYSKYTCCASALIWQLLSHAHTINRSYRRRMTHPTHAAVAQPHAFVRCTLIHTLFLPCECTHTRTYSLTYIQPKPWWLGLFLSDWKCSVCNSSSVLQKQRENHSLCSFLVSIYLLSSFTPRISIAFSATDKDFFFF